MALELVFKALAVWLGILLLAIGNGVLRKAVLVPMLGQSAGLLLSGVLLSGLILLTACLALPWMGRAPLASYLAVGIGWLFMTLVFEFTFGRTVQGKPWPELLEAYRFTGGNLWPIVLLVTAAARLWPPDSGAGCDAGGAAALHYSRNRSAARHPQGRE